MNRPERLLLLKKARFAGGVNIEALFVDDGRPIVFNARLCDGERDFDAQVLATNEEDAEFFCQEELLAACWCRGALEPEGKTLTDEMRILQDQCGVPSECNNL